ncbi:DNA polymerase III subunit delta [Pasteurella atlantica]|uniref:DNA polymerase III subunit delta n=3 Tax=Pasteurellaceae TaxID=712 RepID=A0ACC6HJM9_9PAST|nr:DNA polymerase III subunit delta [Pasteurella atlantica]MBR0573938.1 DNA polymerase III subunit delta [Pasteurella atlantica]MDP8034244.1 DNA polymerase III subunit delta [Pasteurella atlantica]MDP8036177.1 DNA polymerase III subunit delta [Pasteurella atlantica]MDP8038127.1 DNA polymerase III subunit delta [Pasteurella atlantica]MDP8039918.1 DNA polymerase III subunit delta [Pasteurella atlantica]
MQKILPEALEVILNKELRPVYFLIGQDLLLVNETKELIIQFARKNDFDEQIEMTVSNETNWEDLFEKMQSIGLFFNRQIVILNLPENINAAYQKKLQEFVSLIHSDLLIIFHFPRFTKTIEKQPWIAQISPLAINCQTPDGTKLSAWLTQRAKVMNLQLDSEANQLLCYSYEGNLLALKQALQLLQLRFPEGKISFNKVKEVIEQSAQFTPFQWIDALLEGKISRALRILSHLKNEDVSPIILLRIIQKELLILLDLTGTNLQNVALNQPLISDNLRMEFDRLKIWQNKRSFYQSAISRLTYYQLFHLCQQLAELERKIKKDFSDEIWLELERFSFKFK